MNYFSRMIGWLTLSLMLSSQLHAQVEINWEQLTDITYTIKNSGGDGMGWSKPKFGESLKELDGKEVKIIRLYASSYRR